MSEELNGPSGSPEQVASGEGQESVNAVEASGQDNKVDYSSFSKVLGEKKALKEKYEAQVAELEKLKQQKLEAEGNKDELISSLKTQVAEKDQKLNQAVANFAQAQIGSALADEAAKMGCSSLELLKAATADQMSSIDFDDSFKPDREQVKAMLERVRQEHPVLFSKAAPQIHDGVPNVNTKSAPMDLAKMSKDDIWAAINKL